MDALHVPQSTNRIARSSRRPRIRRCLSALALLALASTQAGCLYAVEGGPSRYSYRATEYHRVYVARAPERGYAPERKERHERWHRTRRLRSDEGPGPRSVHREHRDGHKDGAGPGHRPELRRPRPEHGNGHRRDHDVERPARSMPRARPDHGGERPRYHRASERREASSRSADGARPQARKSRERTPERR